MLAADAPVFVLNEVEIECSALKLRVALVANLHRLRPLKSEVARSTAGSEAHAVKPVPTLRISVARKIRFISKILY